MDDIPRWLVTAVALVLIVALLVWARGEEHHRGPLQVGSLGPPLLVALDPGPAP